MPCKRPAPSPTGHRAKQRKAPRYEKDRPSAGPYGEIRGRKCYAVLEMRTCQISGPASR